MNKYFFIFFLILIGGDSLGQLTKPIQNFNPQTYKGQNQNWEISQAQNGNIILANHDNLMVYNGQNWEKYLIKKPTVFRTVLGIKDKIYSGGLMEFGYWTKSSKGDLTYTSLVEKLNIHLNEGEAFWNITNFKNYLVFQSLEHVFLIEKNLKGYTVINGNFSTNSTYVTDDDLYYIDINKGIFKLGNRNPLSTNTKIPYKDLIGLFNSGEKNHFISNSGKVYTINDNSIQFNPSIQFKANNIYSFKQLKSGLIALGTIENGLKIFSNKGEIIDTFNKTNGLINNTILSIFEDKENNLWLGLDRGVSLINYQSKFLEYTNLQLDIGSVYTAIQFNGNIYIGTNQGLFYYNRLTGGKIKAIDQLKGQIWKLTAIDGKLFCNSNNGLLEIINPEKIITINSETGFWDIKKDPYSMNTYIAGTYVGLFQFELLNNQFKLKARSENFKNSSRFFEFNKGKIFVNNEYSGLFSIEYSSEIGFRGKPKKIGIIGEKSTIFKLGNHLFYKSNKGIFNILKNTLTKNIALTNLIEPEKHISSTFYQGQNGELLVFSENSILSFKQNIINKKLKKETKTIPEIIHSNLGNSGFENISYLGNKEYLIGLSDGFITYQNFEKRKEIQPIGLEKISVLNGNNWENIEDFENIDAKYNSVKFTFNNPNFQKYEPLEFRFKLDGLDDSKEIVQFNSEIEYINLKTGDYTLYTYINDLGEKIPIQKVNIEIDKSWYFNSFFISVYVLLLLSLFYLSFFFTRSYFKERERKIAFRNQKRLENQELIEKEKINSLLQKNLQSELKNKKRELTITSENIIRKNTLLKQISEELIQIEKTKNLDLSKLKNFIEKNISEKADWKRFENAFNEFDQEFIQKIRIQFGNRLSQQDYLLISYIRSGLNSKEISNLLNISIKSVEMKRYRLRLKMGIDPDKSLYEFITNF